MKIKFTSVPEFLAELEKERGQIDDGILRLTFSYTPVRDMPLVSMQVIAGVVVRGRLTELSRFVGQMMDPPMGEQDANVQQKAEEVRQKIVTAAVHYALDIRSGVFEP